MFEDRVNEEELRSLQPLGHEYTKHFHNSRLFKNLYTNGIRTLKNPLDMHVVQELVWKLRPDNIIETGAGFLGSTIQYAIWMELFELPGFVYGIEMLKYEQPKLPETMVNLANKRLKILSQWYSIGHTVIDVLNKEVSGKNNLVILDSDHEQDYVYLEMCKYEKYVQPGGYMIVEDTCLGADLGIQEKYPEWWRGPHHAVERFLRERDDWEIDHSCEFFGITSNPGGYLRKKKSDDKGDECQSEKSK